MGKRSFSKWLDSSPNTVHGLGLYESDLTFSGVIIDNKDKESKKTKLLNVDLNVPIALGNIIVWDDEKWIIFSKKHMTRDIYQVFTMIKCNQLLKWVDENGHVCSSYAYATGTLDSTIKEQFRTWSSVVVPKPNKTLDVIMPLHVIKKMTRFIIDDEAWSLVDYDRSSVSNVIYLSLVEDTKNAIDDTNEIANIDKIANYEFVIAEDQVFEVGDLINLDFYIKKNGIVEDLETYYTFPRNEVIGYVNGVLVAKQEGSVNVTIHLSEYPEFNSECTITVGNSQSANAYLHGNDSIKMGQIGEYELITDSVSEINYQLDNSTLAQIKKIENKKCYIQANSKNKTGSVVLTATQNGMEYQMTISIIPLW